MVNAGDDGLKQVAKLMEEILDDTSVPRNIRAAVDEARGKILSSEDIGVKTTAAIYLMDDVSNDINMPSHTRTEIWTIISELERVREQHK